MDLICICGHGKFSHNAQSGKCAGCQCQRFKSEYDALPEAIKEIAERNSKHSAIYKNHMGGLLDEPSAAQASLDMHTLLRTVIDLLETKERPYGSCFRCSYEHYLDAQGIALYCRNVKLVEFHDNGEIARIEFEASPDTTPQTNIGISADNLEWIERTKAKIASMEKRLNALKSAFESDHGEAICHCGHGLSRHTTGDGCMDCNCRSFGAF